MKSELLDALIEKIKRQAIIAVFSDDELMDRLVLKGGNLLDIVYGISTRASKDLDFSMQGEFSSLDELTQRLSAALKRTYAEIGYEAFDIEVSIEPPPAKLSDTKKDFWGGYRVYFKLIELGHADKFSDEHALRRNATPISSNLSTKFRIDISKHEYCEDRQQHLLNGYVIYGYSPELFVAEKLRAICQQNQSYVKSMRKHRAARARDFVDICCVIDRIGINHTDASFRRLVERVFAQKRVPLKLLGEIANDREFHRGDFVSVQETVRPGIALATFDEYFNRVESVGKQLKPVGNK